MTLKATEIKVKVNGLENRLGKVTTSPGKLRDIATRKETAEMEALEAKALSFLRYHRKENNLSKDELFKAVDANKDPKAKADADGEGEEELDTAPEKGDLQKVFKSFD